jgi:hypothetical protein
VILRHGDSVLTFRIVLAILLTKIINITSVLVKTRELRGVRTMTKSNDEPMSSDVLEKGLLAHVIRRCSENSGNNADMDRRTVGIICTIVRREHFQDPVLGRIFAAVKLWSADASACLAAELYAMFQYVGDATAARALVDDLSCAPFPESTQEAVAAALAIREQADYRENARLEEAARGLWIDEECEREDTPVPDEEEEW